MPVRQRGLRGVSLAVLLVCVVMAGACTSERADAGDEVLLDPQRFIGEEVTVRAPLTNYLSSLVFVVAGGLPSTNDLVVIDPQTRPFGEGDVVEVTGTIGAFDVEEAEDDYDLYLNSPLYDRLAGELVLFADRVELVEGDIGP